ncbi:MAG: hypothetical protein SFX74_06250 [Fimbriimonadaceae bacterium]|nr:hypothetical protein [Fimbriimonadaceae bacterium]
MKKVLISMVPFLAAAVALADDCHAPKDAFMAEAEAMMAAAEGKPAKKACCRSTVAKPVVKMESGCCNAKGETPKFKVFVAGNGYKFFGCEGSAAEGRKEMIAKGAKVGRVQKLASR